jgi:DMSO/TMAO reductase YedYZ molybdopterin-dependent catalytic subunit
MVRRPVTLSYADLLDREIVETDITLTCVSNEVGGSLIGTARWLGVRLDDLLDEAGIDPRCRPDRRPVGRRVDERLPGRRPRRTGRARRDRHERRAAPLEHGYPARLIVPGLYGYVSATKWLTSIDLARFDQFDAYWVERDWSADGTIKLQSRIDTPRGLATLPMPAPR